jgi:hypothetical protein
MRAPPLPNPKGLGFPLLLGRGKMEGPNGLGLCYMFLGPSGKSHSVIHLHVSDLKIRERALPLFGLLR